MIRQCLNKNRLPMPYAYYKDKHSRLRACAKITLQQLKGMLSSSNERDFVRKNTAYQRKI